MRSKPNAYRYTDGNTKSNADCYTCANYQRNTSTQCNSNANSDASGYSDRDTHCHISADAAAEV
jgi:hypothetical protein